MGFSCLFRRSPCGPRLHKEVCHMRQHLIAWMPPPGVGVHPCTPQSRFPGHPNGGSRLVATATLRNRTHTSDFSFHSSPPCSRGRPRPYKLMITTILWKHYAIRRTHSSREAAPRRGGGSETFRRQTYIGILKNRQKNAEKLQDMREQRIAD